MLAKKGSSEAFATTNATLTGAGAINCLSVNTTSDKNLKTNINTLSDKYKNEFINSLNPVEYNFKHDLEHKRFGFIAQEVESLISEKVALVGNEDEKKSLNYLELISPIVSVLQNVLKRLDNLEKRNLL
jgi:hypothetical protein